jgi:dTDP-4-dehydrorhamnose reductase
VTDDLVRRLRCYADIDDAVYNPWVYGEAADRIEDLTKSNTNLRILAMTNSERVVSLENSFRTILDHAEQWVVQEIARKALEGKDD